MDQESTIKPGFTERIIEAKASGESYPIPLSGNAPGSCRADPFVYGVGGAGIPTLRDNELGDFIVTKQSGTALVRLCSLLGCGGFLL
jgi:hypothetical protein